MNSKLSPACLIWFVFLSLASVGTKAIADTITTNVIQDGGILTTSDGSLIVGNDDVDNPAVLTLKNGAETTVITDFKVGANGDLNDPNSQTKNSYGIVDIHSGSKLNTGSVAILGFTSDSYLGTAYGEVNVSDPDSVWNSTGGIIVGFGGSGRLTIANGGVVSSPLFQLGFGQTYNFGASDRSASVAGQGSKLLSNGLIISLYSTSTAQLTVSDDASVEVNGKLTNDSKGVVNVNNGSLATKEIDNNGTINLNDGTITTESLTNTGNIEINGGTFAAKDITTRTPLNFKDGNIVIHGGAYKEYNSGNPINPNLVINGDTSSASPTFEFRSTQPQAFQSLTIGDDRSGRLVLDNAKQFYIFGESSLGAKTNSSGTITIENGSTVQSYGGVVVGDNGTGMMSVLSGSNVSNGQVIIAKSVGSHGDVSVVGTDTVWKTGRIEVGREGVGGIQIEDGANATSANVSIGGAYSSNSTTISRGSGNAVVTGQNSSWSVTGRFDVGFFQGHLEILDGASVICDSGSVVASYNDSIATAIINGESTTLTALRGFAVGSYTPDVANVSVRPADGNATLVIENGAHLISQWTDPTVPFFGGLMILHGGTLTGNGGFIVGNVNNWGGTVSPGSSPGMMTIEGNYTQQPLAFLRQTGGQLQIELAGRDQGISYDFLHVTGTTTLDGLLDLSLLNGFEHSIRSTDSFTILTSDGGLTGAFDNVGSDHRLETEWGSFLVTYDSHSVVLSDFVAVPETSSLLLTGLGVCGAIAVAVRKR